jgi:glycine cleavage system H lipoate-binding protein
MLAVILALMIVIVLTAHYVLVERPRRRAARADPLAHRPAPLWKTMGRFPRGLFLQPTFTWCRIDPSGELEIGVHPLLTGLAGPDGRLRLLSDGTRVGKGAPLARLSVEDRSLTIRSPVAGWIRKANDYVALGTSWTGTAGEHRSWLYRIEPDALGEEVPNWMIGQRALEWTKERYGEVRAHLLMAGSAHEPSPMMADGGDLPVGILADLDPDEWETFQELFLAT